MYYTNDDSDKDTVKCGLCPHVCLIGNDRYGFCGVRKNVAGRLYTESYGKITAINLDPIEKKPLRKFMKKTKTLSISSFGCNFRCPYCQNYTISMQKPEFTTATPEQILDLALQNDIPSISYTYNEPTTNYEFVYETAMLANKNGVKNILVTNGYISKEPLLKLLDYIDAMNIDLKTYNENTYMEICKGELDRVKETITTAHSKCHVEITTLIVTDMNDKKDELEDLFKWLSSVDKNIPLHLTKYYPSFKYKKKETDIQLLKEISEIANKYLSFVYV